jgi:hypothetical protein
MEPNERLTGLQADQWCQLREKYKLTDGDGSYENILVPMAAALNLSNSSHSGSP